MRSLQEISSAPAGGISQSLTCTWAFLSILEKNDFFSNPVDPVFAGAIGFMESKKKELREALKLVIKGLIIQEVRRTQLEQSSPAPFVLDEMIRSIEETKRQVIALARLMPPKERELLVKRLIRQSVDEEVDQAIRVRQKRCFRCIHVRYFDDAGAPHSAFPTGEQRARVIGCEMISSPSGVECRSFTESSLAISIGNYLDEVSIFYEVKEMLDQFEKIWEDYLTR